MRNKFRVPPALATLATVAMVAVVGCSSTAATPTVAPATQAPTTAPAAVTSAQPTPFSAGVDDGTKITMWTRAATQARAQPLVKAYNDSHKNQVTLTVIPTDDYNTKVSTAAAAKGLPDLLSGDVVFMPNWTSAGLFQDLTSRINALPFKDNIAPGAIMSSTWDGKEYGLPFVMDLSVWMYNKKLFTQAGLDPNKPPTTLGEFEADARAVAKLGGNIHGTFFGGDCGGCGVFTWWPIIWADGQQVMSPDGKTSLLNSDDAKALYTAFHDMVADGTALMPDSRRATSASCRCLPRSPALPTALLPTPTSASPRSPGSRAARLRSSAATPSRSPRTAKSPIRRGTSSPGSRATTRRST
jgi:ABC-type glycerol-3-phosphate transport system substrate-binding protein